MDETKIYQAINAVSNKVNDVNRKLDSIIQRLDALEKENSDAIFDIAEEISNIEGGAE